MLPLDWGPVYRLGRVIMTPNARARVPDDAVARALLRHARKTWGEEPGIRSARTTHPRLVGCRVLTASRAREGPWFWIITEADLQLTTVLLPEEYRTAGAAGEIGGRPREKARSLPGRTGD